MNMRALTWRGRATMTLGAALALVMAVLTVAPSESRAQISLNVDLASEEGPSNGVGLGFLYGVTGDGSQPSDELLAQIGRASCREGVAESAVVAPLDAR